MRFLHDLRRRRVFRLAGLYIVGAWVVIEVASVFFPAWGIPDSALRYLFVAAAMLFPIAIVFAWIFDVTPRGVVRTRAAVPGEAVDLSLRRTDYAILAVLLMLAAGVIYEVFTRVPRTATSERLANSIAVLPFKNLDAQRDTEYFSDGITEEILHRLSSNHRLHVLASTSSFAFRNSEDSAADLSAKLGVEYLLHGSVRRDADQVRVTARLMDRSGVQLWSESFDRKMEAIFAIQAEIAGNVTSRIIQQVVAPVAATATVNAEAYDEYLLGRSFTRSRAPGWQQRAETVFRGAIDLDPEFAPAHAGLAYALFVNRGEIDAARESAQRALQLDAGLAEAHAILGIITLHDGDPRARAREAERILRRALELDPSYAESYNWLAAALQYQDRVEETTEILAQGYRIDPLSPSLVINLANAYARAGDFERAERMKLRLTQLPDPPWMVSMSLWRQYMEWGRFAEALRWVDDSWERRMFSYASMGMLEIANALLAENAAEDDDIWFFQGGSVLLMQGRHAEALERIDAALAAAGESLESLPPDVLARAIVIHVEGGRYEEPLRLFETRGAGELDTFGRDMETGLSLEAAAAIAFAYQRTGEPGRAQAILDALSSSPFLRKDPPTPSAQASIARLRWLSGDADGALAALGRAVELGWADYHRASQDVLWGDAWQRPEFQGLKEQVLSDLADQRGQVEAREAVD